ncbi:MAG: energy transducer TonB [Pseudomonadota bacterium]
MGEAIQLRPEDRTGLLVALVLHVAVLALFLLPKGPPAQFDIPERMTVSLASEVSLESAGPEIVTESRASIAPTISDQSTPPIEQSPPEPAAVEPSPAPANISRPTANTRAPAPDPDNAQRRTETTRSSSEASRKAEGSRIGNDFLKGGGSSTNTDDTRLPASEIGPSAKASIVQSIIRAVKPHWNAPAGADADQLVTVLAFELNDDGSLKGRPRVISQSGVTASNRPQAPLHAERAIRAVQLAAPFELPTEYYNAWKSIRGARFDRNLSR